MSRVAEFTEVVGASFTGVTSGVAQRIARSISTWLFMAKHDVLDPALHTNHLAGHERFDALALSA